MKSLLRLRKLNGMTQIDVASKLGVSYQCYAGYEKGRSEPNIENIIKLADIFDVTTDYLLGRTSEKSVGFFTNSRLNISEKYNEIQALILELTRPLEKPLQEQILNFTIGVATRSGVNVEKILKNAV